ncbi:hypothetical protein QA584_07185 [Anaerocolumna sp. AGMB13025]|uniref:hypothetical protein n=1 Tax=Anaerocolumna sp. AGMB13025 TaxID=3039116 RepID=UPI00241F793F|nr:hypothetical protein [Anaerocolumna sp. AGMB13025]WFR58855.1 hypothetical protein QA584_07185 [Anaerocolumna sp. AGMB13025]
MKVLKIKKTAVVITAVLVILSSMYGSHHSLMVLRNEVLEVFYNGEKSDGKGINSDLEYISDECYNLTIVAGRYIDKEDERITDILSKRELLAESNGPGSKYKAREQLVAAAMVLYQDIKAMELSERDRYYIESFLVNVNSRELILSHSSYNGKAREFNRILEVFPAKLFGKLTMVKPLELYE